MPPAAQAQRALDAVAGVDLNPFAVEIARFRLLLAALQAAGVTRLAAAPDFVMHLAAGDSLLHGRHFFRSELGGADEGFGGRCGITMRRRTLPSSISFWGGSTTPWWAIRPTSRRRTRRCGTRTARYTKVAT